MHKSTVCCFESGYKHFMFARRSTSLVRSNSTKMVSTEFRGPAEDFLSFINASPTPFHAVAGVKERLSKAGFNEVKVGAPCFVS